MTMRLPAAALVAVVATGLIVARCARKEPTGPPPPPPEPRVGWYAAVTGSSTDSGTFTDPWDLATALAGGNGHIQPGDTLWIRGGTYTGVNGFHSTLTGTASARIIVRGFPGERAIIDKAGTASGEILTVDGAYTTYWGFEIMNSATERTSTRKTGVYLQNGTNIRLVNLVIHDTGMGVFAEEGTGGAEIYGCLIWNVGWEEATRSNGHALYLKQNASGSKLVRDNVMFNEFGFGIHVYSDAGTGGLENETFIGNVAFNSGSLSTFSSRNFQIGGQEVATGDTARDNVFYFSAGVGQGNTRLGYQTLLNGSVVFQNNLIVGGSELVDDGYWQNAVIQNNTWVGTSRVVTFRDTSAVGHAWSGNTFYRDPTATAWSFQGTTYTFTNWKTNSGLSATDAAPGGTPSATQVIVKPNAYEAGVGYVVIINWANQASVPVNLSTILSSGDKYQIRNVQDVFGSPVASGTYSSGTVSVSMAGVNPPAPIGGSPVAPVKTGPAFDVFVVTRVP